MAEKDNMQVVEKWIEALNAHDASQLEKYRAPGYLFDAPVFPGPVGVSQEMAYTQGLFEAFSDFHIEVAQTIAQGDFVVANVAMTGTNDGPITMPNGQTVPATGKMVAVPVSNTFQLANGKIVRNSLYADLLGLMGQLVLLPAFPAGRPHEEGAPVGIEMRDRFQHPS
jgi:steroid delta-isomerase-like uncharacterized protein